MLRSLLVFKGPWRNRPMPDIRNKYQSDTDKTQYTDLMKEANPVFATAQTAALHLTQGDLAYNKAVYFSGVKSGIQLGKTGIIKYRAVRKSFMSHSLPRGARHSSKGFSIVAFHRDRSGLCFRAVTLCP